MFENIRVNKSNFCIGPQTGTYCSVDYENDPVVMHVVNDNGGLIRTYGFYPPNTLESGPYVHTSSAPVNSSGYFGHEFVTIKYIGPRDQDSYFDGAVFYTLERRAKVYREFYTFERDMEVTGHPYKIVPLLVGEEIEFPRPTPYELYGINDIEGHLLTSKHTEYSSNIIRRWLLDAANDRLVLHSTVIKDSNDTDWFGGETFAVMHTVSPMTSHTPKSSGEITITTTSGLKKYDTIMLGPSADQDNVGEIEEVYVHKVIGNKVIIKTYGGYIPPKYDYMEGDAVTTFGDIILFSDDRPLINEEDIEYTTATSSGTLFHLDQTNYGEVYHREYNGAFSNVKAAVWNVYMQTLSFVKASTLLHMDLDDYEISRAQNIGLEYPIESKLINIYDLEIKDVTIYKLQDEVIKKDDSGMYSKQSWSTYNYHADSLLPYSFSIALQADNNVLMVADRANIIATVRDQFGVGLINKNVWFTTEGDAGAIITPLDGYGQTDADGKVYLIYDSGYNTQEQIQIKAKADGGNITHGTSLLNGILNLTQHSYFETTNALLSNPGITSECTIFAKIYLITIIRDGHIVDRYDGSVQATNMISFTYPGNILEEEPLPGVPLGEDFINEWHGLITVCNEPSFHNGAKARLNIFIAGLLLCNKALIRGHALIKNRFSELYYYLLLVSEGESNHTISQNYISRHLLYGHTATVSLDQFVFVQEAIPAMWSEKNNIDTDYWIRLRPFASDLNPHTLIIKFREDSYLGLSDWYNVTPFGNITMFDAGGGLLGIDFHYTPATVFHHNAIVYVYIEVYDTSNTPNKIILEYWFKLIPDFKAPHLANYFPAIEESSANVNTDITFDCLDIGEGVDINTLEVYVNNRSTTFTYEEFEHGNYHITCELPYNFHYGQIVNVVVNVRDRSANANRLFDGWKFFITDSTEPWFNMDNTIPARCLEGLNRDQDVSLQVYGVDDAGIAYDSLRLEVGGRYRNIKITPIVYRLN